MEVINGIADMKSICRKLKTTSRISFVPTMGKLHDGHSRLISEAKKYGETVVSIFVNPIQFGENEDFDRYPRDMESDKSLLEKLNVRYLFHPGMDIISENSTFTGNPSGSGILCGLSRKGHFQGVLTIVLKLFGIINPDFSFFGMKDYQQYILVKKMAEDYFLDTEVIPVPTVREKCGLAMSSRNLYLSEEDRKDACKFYQILAETVALFASGEKSGEKLSMFCIKKLLHYGFNVEYLKIMDAGLNTCKNVVGEGDIMLSAVKFKDVRLIDNIFFKR